MISEGRIGPTDLLDHHSGGGAAGPSATFSFGLIVTSRLPQFLFLLTALMWSALCVHAQERYRTPPPELARLVDAPRAPTTSVSPDRARMLLLERPALPSIAEISGPEVRLAGIRFDPVTFGPSRSSSFAGIRILSIHTGDEVEVTGIPDGASIGTVRWSQDGRRFAFLVTDEESIRLFVADADAGRARPLDGIRVNNVHTGAPYEWMPDDRRLLVRTVLADRAAPPERDRTPTGPSVRVTGAEAAPSRTYPDLLGDEHDEALFRHYVNAQLVIADVDGSPERFADPMLIASTQVSPDGGFVLVETVQEPLSRVVPAERFPRRFEVVDRKGNVVHRLADLPAQEHVPSRPGSAPSGPRAVRWRDDAPATLAWVESVDGGDATREADVRDQVLLLPAPFDEEPVALIRLPYRYAGIHWARGDLALMAETWPPERVRRVYRVRPDDPEATPEIILAHATDDRYDHPGYFVTEPSDAGSQCLVTDGSRVFMTGVGASPEGSRPFLRSLDVESGETTELFRSEPPFREVPVELLSTNPLELLTRRESRDEPPNYYLRNVSDGTERRLTHFEHPYPDLADIQTKRFTYEREDGVQLGATVYLPPDYDSAIDDPLPGIIWAYPRSFQSADAAGQVSGSSNRFTYISYGGAVPFVTQGYAVILASMPVVGSEEQDPNDALVEQLVMGARAAIEMGAAEGFLDPDRVAVGGHSYGAFMTANLLAHSNLFRAGIAQSGAYNRTLTPFGFQSESRSLWDAPEVYLDISPFIFASEIDEPLLLIHGAADSNSGTYPMQSERLFDALRGLGKTARLVMLPEEGHNYSARESVLQVLWEMNRWLDEHVRNARAGSGGGSDGKGE